MTYFPKNQNSEWSSIVPLIVLPLIYKDFLEVDLVPISNKLWVDVKGDYYTNEVPLTLNVAIWKLSNLIIADLIEDKLGYEKNDLKLTDKLFSDLGADSLDLVEIALFLEKTAGIHIHEGLQFERVSDLIDYVFSIMLCKIEKSTLGWPRLTGDILNES
uniref:Acyl carrier protein n=1 Tax=Monodopsis sp. MarTras21 TaxID=1745953 RepID=A0A1D8RDF4_9STRA|nr:acyl carrier protein [Monodopsis sp. MarTras21]